MWWKGKKQDTEEKKSNYDACHVAAAVGEKAHLRMK